MKISLITACYNRQQTIACTIESVVMQNYPEVEYIIIDGASTDNTLQIIKNSPFSTLHSQLISEADSGMYEAINKGIRLATGDVIGLLHSDDEFYSADILSKIARIFEQTQADIVYGNGIYVDAENPQKIVRNWISGGYDKKKMKRGWLPLHPTVYVKREVFEICGLYNESYKIAADSDMLVRMLYENNFHVYYLNEYIVRMNMGGMSTSSNTQLKKWKEDLRMYRSHGFNPYISLAGKITSKVKQFL